MDAVTCAGSGGEPGPGGPTDGALPLQRRPHLRSSALRRHRAAAGSSAYLAPGDPSGLGKLTLATKGRAAVWEIGFRDPAPPEPGSGNGVEVALAVVLSLATMNPAQDCVGFGCGRSASAPMVLTY